MEASKQDKIGHSNGKVKRRPGACNILTIVGSLCWKTSVVNLLDKGEPVESRPGHFGIPPWVNDC